jgi:hypothetical protein
MKQRKLNVERAGTGPSGFVQTYSKKFGKQKRIEVHYGVFLMSAVAI